MDMSEEMTSYVLRNKGAKQTPDLKSFNSKYKWNVYDKLLHRQSQRITDREANIMFRKHIIESQNRINYRNEFDRLHGIYYANPNLPAPTKDIIKKRQKDLQGLVKNSLSESEPNTIDRVDVDKDYN